MGLISIARKYKDYETRELKRRLSKKKKRIPYKELTKAKLKRAKKRLIRLKPKGKINKVSFTRAIGNPYGVKLPK